MTLEATIKTNKEIMRLIKSKYPDIFPTGYNNPDSRYYEILGEANIIGLRHLEQSKKTEPDQ